MYRRRALALFVNSVVALVGGGLTALLGAFALRPPAAGGGRWVRAGTLSDLTPNRPVPRVLAVSRYDGWYRDRARQTVFLVWDGDQGVRALSATCTHLGCQVRWDAAGTKFRCPCHGGVFDAQGSVVEGPPPRPLDTVEVRVDAAADAVLVRL
jgi:nitrite reductase/ring-hydroxylating ferredoxin subunit